MKRKFLRAIYSYLVVIMTHVIKWISQEEKKSKSWRNSISNSQKEIEKLRKDNPSISDDYINEIWNEAFIEATKKAEEEMGKKSTVDKLTWEQIFKTKYIITVTIVIGLGIGFKKLHPKSKNKNQKKKNITKNQTILSVDF